MGFDWERTRCRIWPADISAAGVEPALTARLPAVDFAPVAERDESYFVLCDIEVVNEPVIANAEPELGPSGHAVMGERVKTASMSSISNDQRGDILRQPGKSGVEFGGENLRSRAGHRIRAARCASGPQQGPPCHARWKPRSRERRSHILTSWPRLSAFE